MTRPFDGDAADATMLFITVMDAFDDLFVQQNEALPLDAQRGLMLLTDLVLQRLWPALDVEVQTAAVEWRRAIGRGAVDVRRQYGIAEVQ